MARWCVGDEPECNGPDCGRAEDCPYYRGLAQDGWEREAELEKRKEDMEHTDDTGKPGHDPIASVCRDMREVADANERLGFHDLRNLSTDSLRAWADIVEETPKNAEVDEDTSDGYHTFRELYRYRMLYNAAFFNMLARHTGIPVVKSRRHGDGEACFGGGWFIVSAQLPTGQVSNHYEDRFWELFDVPEAERAPEWDGHTPNDAADRLESFLEMRCPEKPESGGNAAAMREALELTRRELQRVFEMLPSSTGRYPNMFSKRETTRRKIGLVIDTASSALSAPARNCDVGTAQEQYNRWNGFCGRNYKPHVAAAGLDGCDDCELCEAKNENGPSACPFAWAQMPYVEKKEESNG